MLSFLTLVLSAIITLIIFIIMSGIILWLVHLLSGKKDKGWEGCLIPIFVFCGWNIYFEMFKIVNECFFNWFGLDNPF
jgi:hypothetical protein